MGLEEDLIDALKLCSTVTGRLQEIHAITLFMGQRAESGDGWTAGETFFEVFDGKESVFSERPGYRTLQEAVAALVNQNLVVRLKKAEAKRAATHREAEDWAEECDRLQQLINTRNDREKRG